MNIFICVDLRRITIAMKCTEINIFGDIANVKFDCWNAMWMFICSVNSRTKCSNLNFVDGERFLAVDHWRFWWFTKFMLKVIIFLYCLLWRHYWLIYDVCKWHADVSHAYIFQMSFQNWLINKLGTNQLMSGTNEAKSFIN